MEVSFSTATRPCLPKAARQPPFSLGRLSHLSRKCLSSEDKALALKASINRQGLPSEYHARSARKHSRSWKTWLWNDNESEPPSYPSTNPSADASGTARCAALLLYRALLLVGLGLGMGGPAMAGAAPPPPVSEVRVQRAVEKAAHNTAEKNAQLDARSESAEKAMDSSAETSTHAHLGEEFWKEMDLSKGSIVSILKNILESDPMNRDALECLAKTLVDNDDATHALVVIEKLEKLEPEEMEWKYLKGVAYDMESQFQEAKKIYQDILKIEPLSSKAIQGLMMAMDELGETDDLLEIAESAMALAREEKNITEARNIAMLIGQYYMMKGHLHDALDHYEEMMEEDKKDFRPHLCQGIIYSALGEKAKAEKQFKAYEKLCPKDYQDRKYLDALMLKARQEGQERFELKQKEKYVRIPKDEKQTPEQTSDR
eukprot:c16065_g1_i1 orf=52-1341(+)